MASDGVTSGDLLRDAIASLSSPDRVDSPFGALDFFDGVPLSGTVAKAYDALDLMRGIEVFLNAVPGASLVAMRRGLRERTRGLCFSRPTRRRRTARRCSISARGARR
jgi:hypothetical protein